MAQTGALEEQELVYNLGEFEPGERAAVDRALTEREIEHWWEGSDLVVLEADQHAVDHLLERLDHPLALAPEPDGDDGVEAADVLSALFLAADRLRKDPGELTALEQLLWAVPVAEAIGVPYGFESAEWDGLVLRAGELRDAVAAEQPDFDRVRDLARSLRDALRPVV